MATKEPKPETPTKTPAKKIKTGGRTKGVKNKTTDEIKKSIVSFVSNHLDKFEKEFDTLEKSDQILIIVKLLPYVVPKQTETKILLDEELTKAVKESMDKVNEMFK